MKRRALSLLLCGLLALVLLPAAVLAGGDSYDLWVNGRQVTKDNAADVLNDGGTVSYDAANNVLCHLPAVYPEIIAVPSR